jgi:hypothetical protein
LRGVVDDESLQAPEIFAEESFPDANVVAEYLDGQASLEVARAYEDVCGESPEALAEVGRCYDILNNDALNCVVVPKNCRRRLYYIAWEEDDVNVAAEGKSAPILTDFTSSEASETNEDAQNVENIGDAFSKAKKKGPKKSRKSAKNAASIGSTLAAERSWGRRAKRLTSRLILALSLLGAAYCGWRTLNDDQRSETFQIETSAPELAASNTADEQALNEETPLCPTTISSLELDEILASSPGEPTFDAENVAGDGNASWPNAKTEPYKTAALPNEPSERENVGNNFEEAASSERKRVGLGGDKPWERRPSIEIPAQNNDVFTKTKLY